MHSVIFRKSKFDWLYRSILGIYYKVIIIMQYPDERIISLQRKSEFGSHGADGRLIDQLDSAFRKLEDIASPELVNQIRHGE